MKNFILKYKIKLLLILFFVFMLFGISTNVFATDVPQALLDKAYEMNNNNDNYVILQDKNTKEYYFLIVSDGAVNRDLELTRNWKYIKAGDMSYTTSACVTTGGTDRLKLYKYVQSSGVCLYQSTVKDYTCDLTTSSRDLEIVYTTKDVYYYGTTDVFFPIAPPEEEAPATLLEVLEQEKGATLQEIVALLPVILSVLVSLIALRKALRMLSNFLRKS